MNLSTVDMELIGLAVAAIALVGLLAWLFVRNRRNTTAGLQKKFGSEYQRAVEEHGSERKAEAKLALREKRVEELSIRELNAAEHDSFLKRWESIQSRFVDSPKGALMEADDLVISVMKARGYPMSDFEQRAADISVDHPEVVANYRSAHATALRVGSDQASTEELRTAMIRYRSLFEELAHVPANVATRAVA
jgi:FtsZ-interacting cell division protein ZipA